MADETFQSNLIANVRVTGDTKALNALARLESAQASIVRSQNALARAQGQLANATSNFSKVQGKNNQVTIQASQQVNDFFLQVQGGQNIMVAATQQLSQLGFVMSNASGVIGRAGAILAGPWGAALITASALLTPFITNLFNAEKAQEKVNEKLKDFSVVSDISKITSMDLAEATDELNRLTGRYDVTLTQHIGNLAKIIEIKRRATLAAIENVKAILAENKATAQQAILARETADRLKKYDPSFEIGSSLASGYATQALRDVAIAERAIEKLEDRARRSKDALDFLNQRGGPSAVAARQESERAVTASREVEKALNAEERALDMLQQKQKEYQERQLDTRASIIALHQIDVEIARMKYLGVVTVEQAAQLQRLNAVRASVRSDLFGPQTAAPVSFGKDDGPTSALPSQIEKVTLKLDPLAAKMERARKITDDFKASMDGAANEGLTLLSDAIADSITGAKSWSEAFENAGRSIVSTITKIIAQFAILKALEAFGVNTGAFGFAKGGVFDNGQVQPFASGGVVNSPTYFPMARGTGLMGEAGPEAIMPLKRGSNGKLGVESNKPVINIINNAGAQVSVDDRGDEINIMLDAAVRRVATDIRRGDGQIASAIQGTYRLSRNRG